MIGSVYLDMGESERLSRCSIKEAGNRGFPLEDSSFVKQDYQGAKENERNSPIR